MPSHKVEQGESLYTIAAKYAVATWQELRDHGPNAALRDKRPHPQILQPGDVVEIPDPSEGTPAALDGRTQFVRRPRDAQPLKLTLEHLDGSPMKECEVTVEYDGKSDKKKTTAAGLLDLTLPLTVKTVTVTAGEYRWEIDVAHLNPTAETPDKGLSGCQGRLRNLGFFDGEVDGAESEALTEAVGLFQVAHELPRTGQLDDATRAKLLEVHGC